MYYHLYRGEYIGTVNIQYDQTPGYIEDAHEGDQLFADAGDRFYTTEYNRTSE